MDKFQKKGFPLIGVIFLVLGVFKLLQGDDWVVWTIIGVLFGGLGAFSRRNDKQPQKSHLSAGRILKEARD